MVREAGENVLYELAKLCLGFIAVVSGIPCNLLDDVRKGITGLLLGDELTEVVEEEDVVSVVIVVVVVVLMVLRVSKKVGE